MFGWTRTGWISAPLFGFFGKSLAIFLWENVDNYLFNGTTFVKNKVSFFQGKKQPCTSHLLLLHKALVLSPWVLWPPTDLQGWKRTNQFGRRRQRARSLPSAESRAGETPGCSLQSKNSGSREWHHPHSQCNIWQEEIKHHGAPWGFWWYRSRILSIIPKILTQKMMEVPLSAGN